MDLVTQNKLTCTYSFLVHTHIKHNDLFYFTRGIKSCDTISSDFSHNQDHLSGIGAVTVVISHPLVLVSVTSALGVLRPHRTGTSAHSSIS